MNYPVAEKFVSINGEGTRAGELAVFVRFKGCNLRCPYCDTKWAYHDDTPFEIMNEDDICRFADGIDDVTLTGGEPMLHDLKPLCNALASHGHRVEIETNGSIPIKELAAIENRPSFTMDYKLPSSMMEDKMCLENFALLDLRDTVKFVVGDKNDLDTALRIIGKYSLIGKCNVYLSPVFGSITAAQIVDFMKENTLNGVRVQLQLHKYIWDPEKRGV